MILPGHLESSAYGIIETDSCYYVGGTLNDTIYYDRVFIKKVPKNQGNIVTRSWGSPIGTLSSYGKSTFIKTADNGFAMIGRIIDTNYYWYGFLMKFDSNCDSLWMKHFHDTISTGDYHIMILYNIKETYDNGFVIVGRVSVSDLDHSDIILIKTDSLGNTEWYKTYGYVNSYDQGWSVTQTPDSGYLIGGHSSNNSQYSGDAYIIRTDNEGNLIWEKFLGGNNSDGFASVAMAYDSNYLIAYSYAYKQDPPSYASHELSVVKINPSKQIIWGKNFRIHNNSYAWHISEVNNHDIVVCGDFFSYDPIYNNSGDKAYIMRLSEIGDSLWCRSYLFLPEAYGDAWSYLYVIKPSIDGGLLACGDYEHFNLQIPRSAWILKTDHNGSYTIGIEENDSQLLRDNFAVYPNPASENIYLQLKIKPLSDVYFELYDIHGRLLRELTITNSYQRIPVFDLQSGVYLYILRNSSKLLSSEKLLIMR